MMATESKRKATFNARISNKVRDYGNDPFVVKKAMESKAFLEKNGFPEALVLRKVNRKKI